MKKFIFLVLLLSYANNFYCQNLTLDELIALRKSDVAQVEEFVTQKNWTFLSANAPQYNEMASATFTYNKSATNDLAESFLTYAYSDTANRLNLQFANKDQYNSYINRLKALGYDFIVSKVQNDAIVKLYLGKGLTIELTVSSKNENNSTRTSYNLLITSSNDYLISFVDQ
ncbi:hypothetical protein [Flavobacterium sp. KACC 22761]|uniref:hypothetical protein n=1 Tax=Flavobacterium sp. KACC 22761 TaxID=3092665 RepID=UPI002A75FCD6|nr:hypothetical protein [Flavobacterium sp. KACC 22761]WPO77187.1 hypothetical protein SCB73_13035 [Flavobacterium sp. KACC 22761]